MPIVRRKYPEFTAIAARFPPAPLWSLRSADYFFSEGPADRCAHLFMCVPLLPWYAKLHLNPPTPSHHNHPLALHRRFPRRLAAISTSTPWCPVRPPCDIRRRIGLRLPTATLSRMCRGAAKRFFPVAQPTARVGGAVPSWILHRYATYEYVSCVAVLQYRNYTSTMYSTGRPLEEPIAKGKGELAFTGK